MATKIRKDQIRIDEFIKSISSADWTSDTLTASAAAILSKIQSELGNVSGAMIYRGEWSLAATETNGIKAGYVYVYNGSGTAPTGEVLENGDTLIAKMDGADPSNAAQWTIVQVNITGAITTANLKDSVFDILESGNATRLSITNTAQGKIKLNVPGLSVTGGVAEDNKYVSAITASSPGLGLTVTKQTLPNHSLRVVLDEAPSGTINGTNKTFTTLNAINATQPYRASLYVNGVKQHQGTDYTFSRNSSTGLGVFTISTSAYVPATGDVVTCDYIAQNDVTQ